MINSTKSSHPISVPKPGTGSPLRMIELGLKYPRGCSADWKLLKHVLNCACVHDAKQLKPILRLFVNNNYVKIFNVGLTQVFYDVVLDVILNKVCLRLVPYFTKLRV